MNLLTTRSVFRIVSTLSFGLLLAGCGQQTPAGKTTVAVKGVSGVVHGGQNPVSGSTIQLYTVGTTADGSNATPILNRTVKTLADGSFDLDGAYSCSSSDATEVYLTATAGDPAPGTSNANLTMMVALGPCAAVPAMSYIEINELTTVAAVNALAPFMKSYTAVGSSGSDVAALQAAFLLANEYVDPSSGIAPGENVPNGYVVPVEELNTLADIAASCVNSGGGASGQNNACGKFFQDTTPAGGAAPTDVIAALLSLAKNPSLNTAALFALTSTEPPFEPTLSAAPANFSVALQPAALMVTPYQIAFSATGVGSTSETETVTIHNTGTVQEPLALSLGGADAGDFSETNNCPQTLAAGAICNVQVVTKPTAAGTRTGSVVVASGQEYSAQMVSLSVTSAAETGVSVDPSALNFPFTAISMSSQLQTTTFTNVSGATLTAVAVSITGSGAGAFSKTQTCGTTLAAGASCTVSVTFTPQVDGMVTATLQLTGSGGASAAVALSGMGSDTSAIGPDTNSYLFNTSMGNLYVELRPDVAPKNVANFLYYVNNGTYTSSIFHRVVAGFINQGGGYKVTGGQLTEPQTTTAVMNEFRLSNVRGTLAMAKVSGNPDSATDQFFFNTADNSGTLDAQNGGYTVIGSIVGLQGVEVGSGSSSLAVMDAINATPTYDLSADFGSAFTETPLVDYDGGGLGPSNFVYVNSVAMVTGKTGAPATPIFSPAGGTFAGPQTITLTDATPGAAIYYYVFGSNAPAPTLYTGPFVISATAYVAAEAKASGYANTSYVNYEYYTIQSSDASAAPGIREKR